MTYEIPQSLQYKERIVFNLTMEQFIYAASAGLLAFLVYAKLPFSPITRIAIASIPLAIAIPFMYFDLWNKIIDLWSWYRFRQCSMFNPALKKYLQLKAVEKNCYVLQIGKYEKRVAVLRVDPLNFKIKPKDERDTIIHSFQKLLNSLDFPIQLAMYTDDLDLKQYLRRLDVGVQKAASLVTEALFKAHGAYLDNLMKERPASNRRFYIIVQENPMGLDAQLRIIDEMLRGMNLKSVRLTGRFLIQLLIKFFNNPRGRTELLKKDKTLYNIVAPEMLVNSPNHIKVNEYYNRIIAAVGYPRMVETGFLDKIITATGNFDLSIHVEPFPIETTMITLNKELQKQRADLYAAELKHSFQPSLEIQYADTKGVLDSIQKGQEKLFNVSLYINAKAKTLEELDILVRTIQSQLNSILIIPKIPRYRMAQGLKSTLPSGLNELAIRRNITTQALSSFFPFTSPFLILEKGGVFLGLNKNKLPIIKDIFALANANGAILATSGSGKSFTAKLLISRYLMTGTKVIVIDPQNEYSKLAEKYGGSVITIDKDSKTSINPLDLLNHTYPEKRLTLLDFFSFIFGQLNETQKSILDRAINETYKKVGITASRYMKMKPPLLRDVYETLRTMEHRATGFEKTTFMSLRNRLEMYVDGAFSFLNRKTEIDLNKPFIVFNIGTMPKQIKPVMMFLILDYIYTQMKHDKDRKLLVIDEAWSLLSQAQEEGYIFEIVKTCRKFNLGLLLITQDVADLLNGQAGRAVLANSSYTILLRQKPAVIASAEQIFHLSYAEREHLLTANVGEGLLMMENDHQELKIVASKEEHDLITTKPEEVVANELENTSDLPLDGKKLVKELYPLKDVYKISALDPVQSDHLTRLSEYKYEEKKLVHPFATAYGRYLVRKKGNEGADHTSLVWWIYEQLLNHTSKVTITPPRVNTFTPDIVFTNAKGHQIAIEIETGSNHEFNPEYLAKKVTNLNTAYPSRWCVFLTTNFYLKRYENLSNAPVYLRKHLHAFLKHHFPRSSPSHNTAIVRQTKTTDDKKTEYGRHSTNITSPENPPNALHGEQP